MDFPEGSSPQDLSNFVQLYPSLWHLLVSVKAVLDDLAEEGDLSLAGTDTFIDL